MPDDLDLSGVEPSFLEDGLGVSGQQTDFIDEDVQNWDTSPTSEQNQEPEDFSAASSGDDCISTAGDPPDTGTYVLGSIDGTCQWIDTTDCSA